MSERTIFLYGGGSKQGVHGSFGRAFRKLGYRVEEATFGEAREYSSLVVTNRILHRLTIRSLAARRLATREWNREFLRRVKESNPQFVLILKGVFLMPETIRRIRQQGIPVLIFHPDNPFDHVEPEFLPAAREASCYLIWSRQVARKLRREGARRVEYLPFAWDPEAFPPVAAETEPESGFDYDVIFIGTWTRAREWWLTPVAKYFDLDIWGSHYWQTRTLPFSPLEAAWNGRELSSGESADVMARSKVVLNPLKKQNQPDGTIMRTFEVPGVGALALSTRTTGGRAIFPEEMAGIYFDTIPELLDQIERYLRLPGDRHDIAQNAHEIVNNRHRFIHRARQIIEIADEV